MKADDFSSGWSALDETTYIVFIAVKIDSAEVQQRSALYIVCIIVFKMKR